MKLPEDPFMLLSFVNMKLRDDYDSFEDFCKSNDLNEKEIIDKLSSIGYEYFEAVNQFR